MGFQSHISMLELEAENISDFVAKKRYREIIQHCMLTGLQNIHTPFELCDQMLSKLFECMPEKDGKTFCVLFNIEFIECLIRDYGVKAENITFLTDDLLKETVAKNAYKIKQIGRISLPENGKNIGVNMLTSGRPHKGANMKFDCVVMNPPYQTKSDEENRKTQAIWDRFVQKSFEICKEGGYLAAVHPAGWRDVDGQFKEAQKLLRSKKISYLEMHDRTHGFDMFEAQTAYDWYVAQNIKNNGKSIIKSQNKQTYEVDLREMEFIPNSMFDEIQSLFAKDGQEKCDVIYSRCDYGTDKENMKEKSSKNFCYPCVYTTLRDGTINLWYSNTNKKGHFGIPKVIFTNGSSYPIVDEKGEYGLTQFAFGIVDDIENLESIQKALLSPKFLEIMNECQLVGKHRYARKVIGLFRKDFWKEFI